MRRRLTRLRDIRISPFVQRFQKKNAALRSVSPIFRGRVEHRGTLRHHIFLAELTVGCLGATLRTGAPFRANCARLLTIVKACPNPSPPYCDIRVTGREKIMQAISRFVRTTVLGGLLFLAPHGVLWL